MASCVPRKKMVYLQYEDEESMRTDTILYKYSRTEYRLQASDIVDVEIHSPENLVNDFFNMRTPAGNIGQVTIQNGGDLFYMNGYSINDSGYILLPIMGKVMARGLTIPELRVRVHEAAKKYLKEFYLEVKLGGLRYTALGEFTRPGKYVILQNQATIFEAIANANDLNMVADRNKIRLIRQYPDGTRIHTINLLDNSIVSSPFYFIQPNDVIYAEPLPAKSWGVGVTGAQTLTTVLSIVSTTIALIVSISAVNRN